MRFDILVFINLIYWHLLPINLLELRWSLLKTYLLHFYRRIIFLPGTVVYFPGKSLWTRLNLFSCLNVVCLNCSNILNWTIWEIAVESWEKSVICFTKLMFWLFFWNMNHNIKIAVKKFYRWLLFFLAKKLICLLLIFIHFLFKKKAITINNVCFQIRK